MDDKLTIGYVTKEHIILKIPKLKPIFLDVVLFIWGLIKLFFKGVWCAFRFIHSILLFPFIVILYWMFQLWIGIEYSFDLVFRVRFKLLSDAEFRDKYLHTPDSILTSLGLKR